MTDTAATETEAAETETEQESPEAETETAPGRSRRRTSRAARATRSPRGRWRCSPPTDGRITPRVVRVPAFISIQVELRSKDGREYGLRFGDVTITAGGGLSSVSTTIDGLRPGKAIVGKPTGRGQPGPHRGDGRARPVGAAALRAAGARRPSAADGGH